MMVLSSLRPDASLVDFLESQARTRSIRALSGRAIVALALGWAAWSALPWGKAIFTALSTAYFSYAVWGLLDRGRSYALESNLARSAELLRVLCAICVALGVASGIAAIFAIGFALLGAPWIL